MTLNDRNASPYFGAYPVEANEDRPILSAANRALGPQISAVDVNSQR